MTNQKIREKIELLKKVTYKMFPDAKTELEYSNPFQLLIAIIMSAQTTDKQVNKVNKIFFEILKTPADWVKLWVKNIEKYINTISFFRNKAKNIFKTCEMLSEKNLEDFDTLEKLTELHWVWIKTAKVFLAVLKDESYLAVDTHVHRVLNRVWIVKTKTPLETNKKSEKIFTTDDLGKLHHCLIMFWRYHCTARKPKCETCDLKNVCDYYKKKTKDNP